MTLTAMSYIAESTYKLIFKKFFVIIFIENERQRQQFIDYKTSKFTSGANLFLYLSCSVAEWSGDGASLLS